MLVAIAANGGTEFRAIWLRVSDIKADRVLGPCGSRATARDAGRTPWRWSSWARFPGAGRAGAPRPLSPCRARNAPWVWRPRGRVAERQGDPSQGPGRTVPGRTGL